MKKYKFSEAGGIKIIYINTYYNTKVAQRRYIPHITNIRFFI